MTEVRAKLGEDECRQLLHDIGREQIAIGAGDSFELRRDGGVDLGVCMANAERRRPTGPIQVAPACGVKQVTTLAAYDARQVRESEANCTMCAQGGVCIFCGFCAV